MSQDATAVKVAVTDHEIHDLLRRRWSPRAFADRPPERTTMLSMLEAARWAPSCFNEQPWNFIIAFRADAESFARVLQCLVEGNQAWAKRAAVLMITVAKLAFDRNRKPNRHAFHDVGLAMENLVIQATAMGVAVHQMGGSSVGKARDALGIPDGYEPVAAVAVGYPGSPDVLDEPQRGSEHAPRSRRVSSTFAFGGTWGQPL